MVVWESWRTYQLKNVAWVTDKLSHFWNFSTFQIALKVVGSKISRSWEHIILCFPLRTNVIVIRHQTELYWFYFTCPNRRVDAIKTFSRFETSRRPSVGPIAIPKDAGLWQGEGPIPFRPEIVIDSGRNAMAPQARRKGEWCNCATQCCN